MSWIEKAVARENEILRMIELFTESKLDFVLVGGYAVSAMGRHGSFSDVNSNLF